ncbi:aldo/keto reductase [Corchorus olitorius]|uniref:Aldo/keto reductase n=1 Tax=Corchorus olitorius TaxID=93759 RepID=A0A1R3KSL9_9ROSI|nr:aldo/keto reductase [Corchorus olitorius]
MRLKERKPLSSSIRIENDKAPNPVELVNEACIEEGFDEDDISIDELEVAVQIPEEDMKWNEAVNKEVECLNPDVVTNNEVDVCGGDSLTLVIRSDLGSHWSPQSSVPSENMPISDTRSDNESRKNISISNTCWDDLAKGDFDRSLFVRLA